MEKNFSAFTPNAANFVPLTPLSFLKRTADLFPSRIATRYGTREYTWAQVYERTVRLGSALSRHGIRAGDTVSVIAPNIPEMFEAHFGVAMAGAVLNAINVRLEAQTIAYILQHADTRAVITDTAFAPNVREALASIDADILLIDIDDAQGPGGERLGEMDYEAFLAQGDPAFDWQMPAQEWAPIALNYTSGTSGRPKGVVYHHRGAYLMAMGTAVAWELPQHPTHLYIVPMFHCNGWGHAWAMAMVAGTVVCLRDITAANIFNAIAEHKVTHFGGAPIVLSMLIDASEEERREFDHPIKVFTAGAPPPTVVLEKTRAMGFDVMQVYGLTETYGHVTQCQWREEWDDLPFETQAEKQSCQGVSFPMFEGARVVDLQTREPVPRDGKTEGEIELRGNCVMSGYYKNPEATAEAFAGGWFHSGDAAVWHENGYIQIKDRLKDVIISGGENISSVEIEGVIYRHPAVAAAAIVARPDKKWGEVPCAFVELKPGAQVSAQEITDFCRQHLAGFKTPKHVVFCELPKTATGKIQKFALREQAKNA